MITGGQPVGVLAGGTTQVTMRVTTNEPATCKWGTSAGTPYASLASAFTTTGGTTHSSSLTGLSDGQSYRRFVRCQDGAGNANAADYLVSFSVGNGVPTSIAAVAAAWAAEPMLAGTVYYYCDCGTGAQGGCVAGNDANPGTDPLLPRRTIGNAATRFGTLALTDTIALCKGGAFDATGQLAIGNAACPAGTTCNDLREYTPTTFAGTAKPLINKPAAAAQLFQIAGNVGGLRILNLAVSGTNGGTSQNFGFFFYRGAHDVTLGNLDVDGFDLAIYNESGGAGDLPTTDIKVSGCRVTNTVALGYLGAGHNAEISYNSWDGNGSDNVFDHTIYLASGKDVTNVRMVGNYIHGQSSPTCLGAPVVAHASIDGLLVKDNTVVVEAAQTTPGCWGMGFNNITGNTHPVYYRNAVFSGNTIINGGNISLTVSSCAGCVIENNVIIQDADLGGSIGISVVDNPARPGIADDVSDANVIRNNTIWFGPNSTGTNTGVRVAREGTGHVIANNVVYSTRASGTLNCYAYPLALGSYAFIDNNHCFSTAAFSWEATRGSLAAWRTAAAGFDTLSFTGDPRLVAPGTDFAPASGSPLIGAGDATHGAVVDIMGTVRPNPPSVGAYEP